MTDWPALTPAQKYDAVKQAIMQDGLSYGQTALRLGTSRVAIAGVVERSKRNPNGPIETTFRVGQKQPRRGTAGGRAEALRSTAARAKTQKAKSRKASPKRPAFNLLPEYEGTEDPTPLRADAWNALPDTHPIALEQLTEHTCHWPLGSGPFTFCGEPTQAGRPYCPAHTRLGTRDLPPRRAHRKATSERMTANINPGFE